MLALCMYLNVFVGTAWSANPQTSLIFVWTTRLRPN